MARRLLFADWITGFIEKIRMVVRKKKLDEIVEFRFNEWRLERSLAMDYFMSPPDFRTADQKREAGEGTNPNLYLGIPTLRFPSVFVCGQSNCSSIRSAELHIGKRPKCDGSHQSGSMSQVRFIAICPNGHIDDFPWSEWIGCPEIKLGRNCNGRLKLSESGAADLSSIKVSCVTCGKYEPLGGAMSHQWDDAKRELTSELTEGIRKRLDNDLSGRCSGRCPWHGPDHYEPCDQHMVATLINATNVFYSKVKTSVFIPVERQSDKTLDEIFALLDSDASLVGGLKGLRNSGIGWDAYKVMVETRFENSGGLITDPDDAKVKAKFALDEYFSEVPIGQNHCAKPRTPENNETAFRRVEFNVLRADKNEDVDLRTKSVTVPTKLTPYLQKMILIEKLRETRVFHGFDRFKSRPTGGSAAEIGDAALQQLFKYPPEQGERWLPGTVVYGEGIYFELNEAKIQQWQDTVSEWLTDRLTTEPSYLQRMTQRPLELQPNTGLTISWASRFLLVHTLAHIVINQLVFECGYSTASLRERLYVSDDVDAPMSGILIYTSSGDSEGTLGGLVRLAEPNCFHDVLLRAIERASWCSADPVCAEVSNPGDANLAACQSCVLLPETSCETFNRGLDRAVVVGTPSNPQSGFFSPMLTGRIRLNSHEI